MRERERERERERWEILFLALVLVLAVVDDSNQSRKSIIIFFKKKKRVVRTEEMGFRELKKEDQNRERQKAEIDFLRSFNPRKFTALESREREKL